MSSRRKVVLATLGNLGAPAATFISAPILAQTLGAFERGQVGAATAPLLLAASAATLGLPEAVTFFVARGGGKRSGRLVAKAIGMVAVAGILSSLLLYVLAPALASGDPKVEGLIRLSLLMVIPSLALIVLRGVSAGRGRWGLIAVERAIGSGMRLVAVVVLALLGQLTPLTATLVIATSTWIGIVAYLGLLNRSAPAERSETTAREALSFGARVWFGSLAGVLLSRVDQLLVAPLSNASELGIYVVAVSIAELVLVFNNAVRDVYFAEESREPDMERVARAARLSTIATLVLACVVGLVSTWGIPVLFGHEFAPAVIPTWILLGAIVLGNPGSLAGAGLSAYGRPHLRSWSLLIALVANVIAIFLLVPSFGAIGAAIATAVGNVIAAGSNLIWVRTVEPRNSAKDFLSVRRADLRALAQLAASRIRKGTRR